jgi:hypothetical protein
MSSAGQSGTSLGRSAWLFFDPNVVARVRVASYLEDEVAGYWVIERIVPGAQCMKRLRTRFM